MCARVCIGVSCVCVCGGGLWMKNDLNGSRREREMERDSESE